MRIRFVALAIVVLVCMLSASAIAETPVEPSAEPSAEPVVTEAKDLTRSGKFQLSEGDAKVLADGDLGTLWQNRQPDASIRIAFPAGQTAGGLFVIWGKAPSELVFTAYGVGGKEIIDGVIVPDFTGMANYYKVLPEVRGVELRFLRSGNMIAELRVYGEGTLPSVIQEWEPPLEKADLLLVSAHQDDEFLFMGGAIPYYNTVEGRAVQVLYMANCGRARYQEALNGLWLAGMRNYPDFLGLPDQYTTTLKDAAKYWDPDKVLEALVDRIRRYKPEVILSHDLNGEYGHGAHRLTAEALRLAIVQAADPTKFPASANKYGAWQAKKLYLHLYKDNQVRMDWRKPAEALNGKTPSEVAKLAFGQHKSQLNAFTYVDGGKYDNSLFGLAFTSVGNDVYGDDLLENTDAAIEREPDPTPEPTPKPSPKPTVKPVVTDEPDETPAPPIESAPPGINRSALIAAVALLVAFGGLGGVFAHERLRKKK